MPGSRPSSGEALGVSTGPSNNSPVRGSRRARRAVDAAGADCTLAGASFAALVCGEVAAVWADAPLLMHNAATARAIRGTCCPAR
jgi:hypothetical protein